MQAIIKVIMGLNELISEASKGVEYISPTRLAYCGMMMQSNDAYIILALSCDAICSFAENNEVIQKRIAATDVRSVNSI